jgi:hypothetical protein
VPFFVPSYFARLVFTNKLYRATFYLILNFLSPDRDVILAHFLTYRIFGPLSPIHPISIGSFQLIWIDSIIIIQQSGFIVLASHSHS